MAKVAWVRSDKHNSRESKAKTIISCLPMSQLQGAWAGESTVFADPEERRVLFATLDSLRQYRKIAHLNVTHRRRQGFYALPSAEWRLLSAAPFNFLSTLDLVDDAIDANADIAAQILGNGLDSFGIAKDPFDGSPEWRDLATSADLDKARSTIRQLYRDWSAEGASERRASYAPVLGSIAHHFAHLSDRENIKILVPGAGLGRLVFELCNQGYNVEGNEVSYHQLMASSWILNQTERAKHYKLFPFAMDFSNVVSRAHQMMMVEIPDVHPATALANPLLQSNKCPVDRMNMTAGEFTELYSNERYKDMFDAVATVFFLDTAPNIIKYIQTVQNCLKPGGIMERRRGYNDADLFVTKSYSREGSGIMDNLLKNSHV
ncbi:MAG: hypothetical protein LQ343_000872 [Gyalolechia ehrenbergii]|nr:MAG: hypothetical protein LQ343_000872 [Gyalolechia ehrenbergii]